MLTTNHGLIHRAGTTLLVADKVTEFSHEVLGHIGKEGQLFEGEQVMTTHQFGGWTEVGLVEHFAELIHKCPTIADVQAWVKVSGMAARICTQTKVYNFSPTIPDGCTISHAFADTVVDWWSDREDLYALLQPYIKGDAELKEAYKDEALNTAFELVTVIDHFNPKHGQPK